MPRCAAACAAPLLQDLWNLCPDVVVMYEPDLTFLRQVGSVLHIQGLERPQVGF